MRLFEEIEDKSRQVEVASKHKSQFLANMSHELRTPLNAILGYTELIIDGIYGEAPEKMRTVMERVQSNGKHLLGLINDVLDLSKIEAGQLVLSIQDYSHQDVVHGVYSAVEPLANSKKLAFKIEVPANLPAGARRRPAADPGAAQSGRQRDQVHRRGRGCRSRRRRRMAPTPSRCAIPARALPRPIKRKFSRNSSRRTVHRPRPKVAPDSACRSQNASSKCMAANCGSNPSLGAGSTFSFTVPIARRTPSGATMNKRILVVEDQEDNRQILRDLFGSAGYAMCEAGDGEAGVAAAQDGAPRSHSHGHPAAAARRLRGDAAHQGRPRSQSYSDHRRDFVRA